MKKITLTGMAIVIGVMMFAIPVMAATTASLAPTSVKVATGQQFNMVVTVNPQGAKDYAEKIEVNYPVDILEVTSFTLGNSGMALTQPGYDSIDNVNGALIKTAGYAGGISSPTMFGTILFTAKKAGSGTVKIGNASQAFQSSGQSAITGTGSSVTVTAAVIVSKKSEATNLAPVSSINGEVVQTTSTPPVTEIATNSQVAAASESTSEGNWGTWVWILVIVIVLVGAYFVIRGRKRL